MKGRVLAALALLAVTPAWAQEFSADPERSFFIAVALGAGLDLEGEARSVPGGSGAREEAYSVDAFDFGLFGGYRFNEIIGLELGWREQQHWIEGDPDWGGIASYHLGHAGARLAWPTATRQTPVLLLGAAFGAFEFGSASPGYAEQNDTWVVGGIAGLSLEQELTLGIVASLQVAYLPLMRYGMDGALELGVDEDGDLRVDDDEVIDRKDFTEDQWVHLMWIAVAMQFEWTFR